MRKREDIKREGQRFLDQKIPLQIAKIDNKQFLHFYSNLFTMGVNCLVFNGYMEDEYKLQLADLVNRPGQNLKEGQIWVENPGLHLTALYFMQEVRRQKFEKLPKELQGSRRRSWQIMEREPTWLRSMRKTACRC